MSITVYQYRIYCITEAQFVYTWGLSPPTKCPNDTTHQVNPASVNITSQISQSTVAITEESVPPNLPSTSGRFRRTTKAFTVPTGTTQQYLFSFPYPVSILGGYLFTSESQSGDLVSIHVAPETIVGIITSPVNTGDVVINVSPTVLAYLFVGAFIDLTNGLFGSNMIEVIGINHTNSTITLISPINTSFALTYPTYVRLTIVYTHMDELSPGALSIGALKIGSAYVPPGVNIKIMYTNNGTVDQRPVFQIEYLY